MMGVMSLERDISTLWREWMNTKPAVTGEPAHVYNLFCSPVASTFWQRRLRAVVPRKIAVSYQAVFVHKKPKVHFRLRGNSGDCEVGDVLLVTSRGNMRGGYLRSALLLQAKWSGKWPESGDQWDLYTNWPPISYSFRDGSKTARRRSISFTPPKAPLACAQYLILDRARRALTVRTATPNAKDRSVSITTAGAFLGIASRRIASHAAASSTDWSRTVWDLIRFIGPQDLRPREASAGRGATRSSPVRSSFLEGVIPNGTQSDPASAGGFAIVHVAIGAPPIPELDQNDEPTPTGDWFWE